jgi:hypothetical protein
MKEKKLDDFAISALIGILSNGREIELKDDDMEKGKEGAYTKKSDGEYELSGIKSALSSSKKNRYKIKTSSQQRIVRESYDIAEAMLKESKKRNKKGSDKE